MEVKEAVERLKLHGEWGFAPKISEALKMAIKSLGENEQLKVKEIAKKPNNFEQFEDTEHYCGNCDCGTPVCDEYNYCPNCGQRLDWSKNAD